MSQRRESTMITTKIQRVRYLGFWGYVVRGMIVLAGLAILGLGIYGIIR